MQNSVQVPSQLWTQPWYRTDKGSVSVFIYIVLIHSLAAAGLVLFPLPGWGVFLTALAMTGLGGLGTTVAYHRAFSHHALKLNPIVEQLLIFFAVFNGSGVPATWVANHRNHHAHSDTVDDVSSPHYGGFWWAHLRCLYQSPPSSLNRWCPDLLGRRYRFWQRIHIPLVATSLGCGWFLFGWPGLFWLGAIRLTYALHLQAAVNSILHMKNGVPIGEDSSRNIWWLGPLQLTAWGENWHGNHHAAPGSASFSRHLWQIDIGWYAVRLLESLGLATDVRRVVRDESS